MGNDATAELARQLAARLRHLQAAHDVQYVPRGSTPATGAVPRGAPGPVAARAGAQAPATRRAETPSPAASRTGVVPRPAPPRPTSTSASASAAPSSRPAPRVDKHAALRQQAETWSAATKLEYLRKKNLGDCRRCGLCQRRNNIVFGVGAAEADIMFVGEAPGADEDRRGEPFVGRAGQLLDRWIVDLGLRREDVYIANVLKCRPPGNRDPLPDEVDKCSPFLRAQIRAIEPKVIVALGRHAGMLLSRRDDMSLRAMRGARLDYDASSPREAKRSLLVPLVVTYHPAYVLRQNGDGETRATDMVMNDLRRALDVSRRA